MNINSAYIEITNVCNLNCRSCYNRSGTYHDRRELSYEQFATVISKLVNEYGCNRILLAGGEPTLHSDFSKLLDLLSEYPNLEVNVVTNGTTDCEKLISSFNSGKLSVQVSLDGSCEEMNARTRGKGSFDKAVHFIKQLDKTKNKPLIKMVISQNNYDDIEAFFDLMVSLDCIPEFAFINGMGNAEEKWDSLGVTGNQKFRALRLIDKLTRKFDVNVNLPVCTGGCPLANPESKLSVLIKNNGAVYPCQLLYPTKYELGNILHDSESVLNASFIKISEIAEERQNSEYNCSKCPSSIYCKKGCMALAEINTKNPLGNDGDCDFRKLQFLGFDVLNHLH